MCMVGGCSRITQDCPPYMIVAGNPPEVPGPNAIGLQRRNVPPETRSQIKEAHRLLYREGLSTSQAVARMKAELQPSPEVQHLIAFVESSERGITK
jgi:UDP-N-acetylglucosamine acyltransferase